MTPIRAKCSNRQTNSTGDSAMEMKNQSDRTHDSTCEPEPFAHSHLSITSSTRATCCRCCCSFGHRPSQ